MDSLTKNNIRGLILKGFTKEEIVKLLGLKPEEDVSQIFQELKKNNLAETSSDFYSELQKDLSKLVLTELNKPTRDSSVILNSIKLQAELQEKKLQLDRTSGIGTKVNKDYIFTRDKEIEKMLNDGMSIEDIAKNFNVGVLSVKQALDRCSLNLDDDLKNLSPSIISETIGLGTDMRIQILKNAYKNNLTRKQVREIVNKIKNETR
jgi:predicted DNA-binding protein YlxM (UPF0122 family)